MTDQVRKAGIPSDFRFRVEIDDIERGAFRECSGLDTTHDPIDYREGADAARTSGVGRRASIVLQAGISSDAELWEWRRAVKDGRAVRKNGTIIMLDEAGHEAVRWRFNGGWPVQWIGASPDVRTGIAAIERLEIAYEGLSKA
jgi:phage tail-like protein